MDGRNEVGRGEDNQEGMVVEGVEDERHIHCGPRL